MKGIVYTRVSSDEQVKGTSLESQEEQCRRYCEQKGIEVVGLFRDEGESAKTIKRTEFLRALEFLRVNKGKIEAFVVLRLDRFARNAEDHFAVRKILTDYGVALHSVTEPIGAGPAEKFIETVLAGAAEFENAIRRQRCIDGLSKKVEQGIWPWFPPIGYRCSQFKKQGLRKIAPDPQDLETAPLIKRAFKEYLTGLYPLKAIAEKLDEWGLGKIRGRPTNWQFVDRMLQNPFYAGILPNPWTKKEIKGLHEALISEEEFGRVQLIRQGRGYGLVGKRLREHPDFPLRKTALCGGCRMPLTGAWTRGRSKKYPYYRCYNPKCSLRELGIPKKTIEEDFIACLEKVAPRKEFLERLKNKVIKIWQEKSKIYADEAEKHKKRLALLEGKRKKIFEMREDSSYSKEEFLERKEAVDNEIAVEKISMSEARIEQLNLESLLSFTEQFLEAVARWWQDIPDILKPRFQKLVFPEGVLYKRGEGFGTAKLGLLFELSQRFDAKNYMDVAGAGIAPAPGGSLAPSVSEGNGLYHAPEGSSSL